MTQPSNKDRQPGKVAGRARSVPPAGPVPNNPPTDPGLPDPAPTSIDQVLARFLAIREALRGPAANDPDRNRKLWVIPGVQ